MYPNNTSPHRVKFGVPFDQICKPDIPGPLLVSSHHIEIGAIFVCELCSNSFASNLLGPNTEAE